MHGSEFKSVDEILSVYRDHRASLALAGLLTPEAENEISAAEAEAVETFRSNEKKSFSSLDEG